MTTSSHTLDVPAAAGADLSPLSFEGEREVLQALWATAGSVRSPLPGDVSAVWQLLWSGGDLAAIPSFSPALAARLLGAYQRLFSRLRSVVDGYELLVEYRSLSALQCVGDELAVLLPEGVGRVRHAGVVGGPAAVRFEVGQLDREVRGVQTEVAAIETRVLRAFPEERPVLVGGLVAAYEGGLFLPWRVPQLSYRRLALLLGAVR